MFREMRRVKQQLSDEECLRILKEGKTAILGVIGEEGYPYTVPLNYVYADGKVYFHGAREGHKMDALRRCGKVSLCVIEKDDVSAQKLTTHFRSVILFGTARILQSEEEIFRCTEALGLKYSDDKEKVDQEIAQAIKALCCTEVTIEHMSGKEAIELHRARQMLSGQ